MGVEPTHDLLERPALPVSYGCLSTKYYFILKTGSWQSETNIYLLIIFFRINRKFSKIAQEPSI